MVSERKKANLPLLTNFPMGSGGGGRMGCMFNRLENTAGRRSFEYEGTSVGQAKENSVGLRRRNSTDWDGVVGCGWGVVAPTSIDVVV